MNTPRLTGYPVDREIVRLNRLEAQRRKTPRHERLAVWGRQLGKLGRRRRWMS